MKLSKLFSNPYYGVVVNALWSTCIEGKNTLYYIL